MGELGFKDELQPFPISDNENMDRLYVIAI